MVEETYMQRVTREIQIAAFRVREDVSNGMTPGDAIKKNCHTAETYNAMMKEYNLKPVIPD
jgi:hypothetical protein